MKKSLLALAVLAGISMLFMGCPSGTDAEPTSDPATNTETPVVTPKTIFKGATLELATSYGDAGEIIKEGDLDVVHVKPAGSYESWKITFAQPIDISGKKIKTTAKFADYDKGSNTFKIAFFSDDTHGSEIDNNTAGIGADNDSFKAEYTAYTSTVAADDTMAVVWTSNNSIEKADFTKIKYIKIVPQTGKGEVWIKDIEFVD